MEVHHLNLFNAFQPMHLFERGLLIGTENNFFFFFAITGSPANFLDVGGGATEKQVTEAFRILSGDPDVRVKPCLFPLISAWVCDTFRD